MWIYFPDAFLSIVAHRKMKKFVLVRARFAGDIEKVFPDAKVTKSPQADYLFRAVVPRVEAGEAIASRLVSIEYDNVKGAVAQGAFVHDLRYNAMTRAHAALCAAQEDAANEAA